MISGPAGLGVEGSTIPCEDSLPGVHIVHPGAAPASRAWPCYPACKASRSAAGMSKKST